MTLLTGQVVFLKGRGALWSTGFELELPERRINLFYIIHTSSPFDPAAVDKVYNALKNILFSPSSNKHRPVQLSRLWLHPRADQYNHVYLSLFTSPSLFSLRSIYKKHLGLSRNFQRRSFSKAAASNSTQSAASQSELIAKMGGKKTAPIQQMDSPSSGSDKTIDNYSPPRSPTTKPLSRPSLISGNRQPIARKKSVRFDAIVEATSPASK